MGVPFAQFRAAIQGGRWANSGAAGRAETVLERWPYPLRICLDARAQRSMYTVGGRPLKFLLEGVR